MRAYGFIFARGGSKGLPGKNIRLLGGEPLLGRAIRVGRECGRLERIIVSTDDPAIAAVARQYGAEVPFVRPAELAADAAPERLAWRHAIQQVSGGGEPPFDVFVSLPPTCPLRTPADVNACIDLFLAGGADTVVTATEPRAHPSFNMIRTDRDGYASVLMPLPGISRRQDAPPVFELTALCYVTSPAFVLATDSYFDGRVKAHIVPPERAVDIDTEMDLAFAEFLFQRNAAGS